MVEDPLVFEAPAKINLYLGVGERRRDGYHDVETVMQTLELRDTVRIEPGVGLRVTCEPDVGVAPEDNLAVCAARALAEALGREPSFTISVTKRIPPGGGLGGGSSDAAAVLAGLATAWDLAISDPVLTACAATLGADVPFFLRGGCALMRGRGDLFVMRLPVLPLHVALVNPGVPVSTAAAYAAFDAAPPPPAPAPTALLAAIQSEDASAVAARLYDGLAGAAAGLVPAVGDALAWVSAREGLLGSSVSGSGSTVFGVFADRASAEETARCARERGWWAEATQTRDRGVGPSEQDCGEENQCR